MFTDGFGQFLGEERGNIVLSDLMPYDLGSLGDYDPLENNMEDVEMRSFDDYFDDDLVTTLCTECVCHGMFSKSIL